MEPARASQTAIDTAHIRALDHEILRPPIHDDALAAALLGADEREARETQVIAEVLDVSPGLAGRPREELLRTALERNANSVSLVLSRACYAEARLREAMARGVRQYVLVGAGLDTFAVRHPELAGYLSVFELDHRQSQADKRERLARAELAVPENLHFGTCDIERESIAAALSGLPYDATSPAVFACLGVTMYLTRPAFLAALRSLHDTAAAGSEAIFDYLEAGAMEAHVERASVRNNVERVRDLGEPVVGQLRAEFLGVELNGMGLDLLEDLGPESLEAAYFLERTDRLHASEIGHIARCVIR